MKFVNEIKTDLTKNPELQKNLEDWNHLTGITLGELTDKEFAELQEMTKEDLILEQSDSKKEDKKD